MLCARWSRVCAHTHVRAHVRANTRAHTHAHTRTHTAPRPRPSRAARVSDAPRVHAAFFNIWKPVGLPARAVSNVLQRLLACARGVGHAGTLDPLAAGVLPVAVGGATKLLPFLPDRKMYEARVKCGMRTVSDDTTGDVLERVSLARVCAHTHGGAQPVGVDTLKRLIEERLCSQLVGHVQQRPPDISAVRVRGQRLYEHAHAGGARPYTHTHTHTHTHAHAHTPLPNVPTRLVHIEAVRSRGWCDGAGADAIRTKARKWVTPQPWPALPALKSRRTIVGVAPDGEDVLAHEDAERPMRVWVLHPHDTLAPPEASNECPMPELSIQVWCGTGVYIRALARDAGQLGAGLPNVPTCLSELARLSSAGFSSSDASCTHFADLSAATLEDDMLASDVPFASLAAAVLPRVHKSQLRRLQGLHASVATTQPDVQSLAERDMRCSTSELADALAIWNHDTQTELPLRLVHPADTAGITHQFLDAARQQHARELVRVYALLEPDAVVALAVPANLLRPVTDVRFPAAGALFLGLARTLRPASLLAQPSHANPPSLLPCVRVVTVVDKLMRQRGSLGAGCAQEGD